jgi:hypothetical protein
VEWIINQVAEAKGMYPSEVEARFEELFPGVDLWSMCFCEYNIFFDSLPRPPLKPLCLEERRQNPYIVAVFGRVPVFSTEQELLEFNEKLGKVIDAVLPLLDKLPQCEFPPRAIGAYRGTICITVRGDQLAIATAEEVYEIIAEKAESLSGIEDVPVTFGKGFKYVLAYGDPQVPCSGSASSGSLVGEHRLTNRSLGYPVQ